MPWLNHSSSSVFHSSNASIPSEPLTSTPGKPTVIPQLQSEDLPRVVTSHYLWHYMKWHRLTHLLHQLWWMLREGTVLLHIVGLFGPTWIFMLCRTLSFAFILGDALFRLIWYYATAPHVLTHVRYAEGDVLESRIDHTEAQQIRNSKPKIKRSESFRMTPRLSMPQQPVYLANNRSHLDIHFPFETRALRDFPSTSRKLSQLVHRVRARLRPSHFVTSQNHRFPVLLCYTGGAWMIGSQYWLGPFARLMSACGFIVVTPDYRNYPAATVSDMIDDVSASIAWTIRNIELLQGDPKRIYLVGQSAGAHLVMLSILKEIQTSSQTSLDSIELQENVVTVVKSSAMAKYQPSRDICGVFALSGMYDLVGMEEHCHRRGLAKRVQRSIFEGNLYHASPLHQLHNLSGECIASNFPRFLRFIHGDCDATAPWSESAKMVSLLRSKVASVTRNAKESNRLNISLSIERAGTHTSLIVEDILLGSSRLAAEIIQVVEEDTITADSNTETSVLAIAKQLSNDVTTKEQIPFMSPFDGINELDTDPLLSHPSIYKWQATCASFISAF